MSRDKKAGLEALFRANDRRRGVPAFKTIRATEPSVRRLFELMREEQVCDRVLAERSGVADIAIRKWRNGYNCPSVHNLEACYNVLGYTLKPIRLPEER